MAVGMWFGRGGGGGSRMRAPNERSTRFKDDVCVFLSADYSKVCPMGRGHAEKESIEGLPEALAATRDTGKFKF